MYLQGNKPPLKNFFQFRFHPHPVFFHEINESIYGSFYGEVGLYYILTAV
jgi:hypothetical protein